MINLRLSCDVAIFTLKAFTALEGRFATMTQKAIEFCQENDRLFEKHGGTINPTHKTSPHCGYPALMKYIQENNVPLPLTPERELEIVEKLLRA